MPLLTPPRFTALGLCAAAALLGTGAAGSAATMRQERRSVSAPQCDQVIIDSIGNVTVVGGTSPTVVVTASLQGFARDEVVARQYLDRIRWFADPSGKDTVRIGVDPRGIPVVRHRGQDGGAGVRVDLRVEMPRTAGVSVVTGDGDVSIANVASVDSKVGSGATKVSAIAGVAYLQARQGRLDAMGVRGNLLATTAVGGVTVQRSGGTVRIRTGGGAVNVSDCPQPVTIDNRQGRVDVRRTGRVAVKAESSSILAEDVGGSADLQTRNGRISVRRIGGEAVVAKTDTGAIEVSQPTATATRYDLRTRNGRIDVLMTPSASLDVALISTLGRVQCRLPLENQRQDVSAHALYGTLGTGLHRLEARSQTGTVRLLPVR